jgi:short-subunit dehydrogenase
MSHNPQFIAQYGPWALVTGATEGIGRAFAESLAGRGLNLILVARRAEVLQELAATLPRSYGIKVQTVTADLGVPAQVDQVIDACAQVPLGLAVLAAGFGTSGDVTEIDPSQDQHMVDVNCRAMVQLVHPLSRQLAAQRRGGLILLGSIVGFQGVARATTYSATKAFVQSLGEGLWHELKPHGVDVLVSAPGPVKTGFLVRANMTPGDGVTAQDVAEESLAALGKKMTVLPGRMSKVLGMSLAFLPRRMRSQVMKDAMAKMTGR